MGCWNHTCSLTNLPIRANEDVYVMILQESEYKVNTWCYPYKMWMPLPFIFTGKYDDYGAVEDCDGDSIKPLIKHIVEYLVELPQGKNEFHDIPVTKTGFDVYKLFEADLEDRLFVKPRVVFNQGDKNKVYRLKHIVYKKHALDMLLKEFNFETWSGTKVSYDFVKDSLFEAVRKNQLLNSGFSLRYHGDNGYVSRMLDGHTEKYGSIVSPEYWYDALQLPCLLDYNFTPEELAGIRTGGIIPDSLKCKLSDEQLEYVCSQFAMNHMLEAYMTYSRKSWTVPSGSGSQSDSDYAQKLTANIILATSLEDRRRNEYED